MKAYRFVISILASMLFDANAPALVCLRLQGNVGSDLCARLSDHLTDQTKHVREKAREDLRCGGNMSLWILVEIRKVKLKID